MSNRSETFGRLLKGAINSIAAYEGKTAPAIEDELGAQIGVAGISDPALQGRLSAARAARHPDSGRGGRAPRLPQPRLAATLPPGRALPASRTR